MRVHPEILHSQDIPDDALDEKTVWEERYRSIVDLENHLHRNGTRIIKFFLHLSEEEQRKRFLERIDEPDKNWKFSMADIEERKFWKDYMQAYEECLSATSTDHAPWYVVPADDKENARLIISSDHSRHAEETQNELSGDGQGAPPGIAVDPRIAGEVRRSALMVEIMTLRAKRTNRQRRDTQTHLKAREY